MFKEIVGNFGKAGKVGKLGNFGKLIEGKTKGKFGMGAFNT